MVLAGVKAAPVNLPGATWQLAVGDGAYETNLTPPGELGFLASFHNTASGALSLASNGTYVKPTILTVSAELSFDGTSPAGYGLLGFYSALSGEHTGNTLAHFTGVALQKDGSLQLIENGVAAATTLKYTGKYDPMQPVTLTYSVDTTKGTVSNISLSGSSTAYAFTSSAFTAAATAFLGIGGTTDGNSFCYFNNLQLWAGVVPPPSPAMAAPSSNPPGTPESDSGK